MLIWLDDALKHAEAEYPKESCGLVYLTKSGKETYFPCRNLAAKADHFHVHHEDYAICADRGEIIQVVHSHPNYTSKPSQADLVECEKSNLPWTIIGWPSKTVHSIQPTGYKAPLVGRIFSFGTLDCYTIVRDVYREELNIFLENYEREDHFWERGENLYEDNFHKEGFIEVPFEEIKPYDLILMALKSRIINHAAIFRGFMDFGGRTKVPVMLHHVQDRLSEETIFGGWWQKNMRKVIRHANLND